MKPELLEVLRPAAAARGQILETEPLEQAGLAAAAAARRGYRARAATVGRAQWLLNIRRSNRGSQAGINAEDTS